MTEVIEFQGLKTHTSFYFKNRKAERKYWDDMLKESALKYKNTFSKYMHEKLHVYFSFHKIFKWFALGTLLAMWIAIFNGYNTINATVVIVDGISSLLFAILSCGFKFKFKQFVLSVTLMELFNSPDLLEEVREQLLK